jgi:hypothetical protein
MSEELRSALSSALDAAVVAFLAVLTPTLVIIARRAAEWFKSQAIRVAVDAGVASAEELGHKHGDLTGSGKLEHAKQVARSMAPKALAAVDEHQLEHLVQGGVARLRPSLSNPMLTSSSVPPAGTLLSIPVQVLSEHPTQAARGLPLPPRMPIVQPESDAPEPPTPLPRKRPT